MWADILCMIIHEKKLWLFNTLSLSLFLRPFAEHARVVATTRPQQQNDGKIANYGKEGVNAIAMSAP